MRFSIIYLSKLIPVFITALLLPHALLASDISQGENSQELSHVTRSASISHQEQEDDESKEEEVIDMSGGNTRGPIKTARSTPGSEQDSTGLSSSTLTLGQEDDDEDEFSISMSEEDSKGKKSMYIDVPTGINLPSRVHIGGVTYREAPKQPYTFHNIPQHLKDDFQFNYLLKWSNGYWVATKWMAGIGALLGVGTTAILNVSGWSEISAEASAALVLTSKVTSVVTASLLTVSKITDGKAKAYRREARGMLDQANLNAGLPLGANPPSMD